MEILLKRRWGQYNVGDIVEVDDKETVDWLLKTGCGVEKNTAPQAEPTKKTPETPNTHTNIQEKKVEKKTPKKPKPKKVNNKTVWLEYILDIIDEKEYNVKEIEKLSKTQLIKLSNELG